MCVCVEGKVWECVSDAHSTRTSVQTYMLTHKYTPLRHTHTHTHLYHAYYYDTMILKHFHPPSPPPKQKDI